MLRYLNKVEGKFENDKYEKIKNIIDDAISEIDEIEKVTDFIEHREIKGEWVQIMCHVEKGIEKKRDWCQTILGIILKNVRWELDGSNKMDEEQKIQLAEPFLKNYVWGTGQSYDYHRQIYLYMNNILLKDISISEETGYMQCAILMDVYNYMRAKTFSGRKRYLKKEKDTKLRKGNKLDAIYNGDNIELEERGEGERKGILVANFEYEINQDMQLLILLNKEVRKFLNGKLPQKKHLYLLKRYFWNYVL